MSETEPLVSTETASTDAGARTAVDAEEIAAEQATVPRRRTSLWLSLIHI